MTLAAKPFLSFVRTVAHGSSVFDPGLCESAQHPYACPWQVRFAVVKVPAGFTKAQSFGLLPRGQAAFLAVEPQAAQAVLAHGSGELKDAVA